MAALHPHSRTTPSEFLWAAAILTQLPSQEPPSMCLMQTLYIIFQRSPLSCALVPVESSGFSLHAWQCTFATVSVGAENLHGMQNPPAAASLSHKPDPFPSVVASFPPCRSLWPSRVKSSRMLAFYQAFQLICITDTRQHRPWKKQPLLGY